MPELGKQPFYIHSWLVDAQNNTLVSPDDKKINLEPKVMDLLIYFCERPKQTLSRMELLEAVWGSQHFTDSTVSRAISILRNQLNDDAKNPVYIKTVARRGYQFIAPTEVKNTEQNQSNNKIHFFTSKAWIAFIFIMSSLFIVLAYNSYSHQNNIIDNNSIAVLPLTQTIPDQGMNFFTEGLHQEIALLMAQNKNNKIFLLGSNQTAPITEKEIRATGAQSVLKGSIHFEQDHVEVIISLEEISSHEILWSQQFTSNKSRLVELRNSVLQSLFNSPYFVQDTPVHFALASSEQAYQSYLKADWHWRQRSRRHLLLAKDLFNLAIEQDSQFSDAYAKRALCELMMVNYTIYDASEGYEMARQSTLKAIELNPESPLTQLAEAQLYFQKDWDFEKSLKILNQIIRNNPNMTDPLQYKAEILAIIGQNRQALETIKRAVKLKPYDALLLGVKGMIQTLTKSYKKADQSFQELTTFRPNFSWYYIYWSYSKYHLFDQQVAMQYRIKPHQSKIDAEHFWQWQIDKFTNPRLKNTGTRAMFIAEAYAALGQDEQALKYIHESVELKGEAFLLLSHSPYFDHLEEKDAFKSIRKQYNLPMN
ncbi:MAG: winged helix-turn-helix domain-containing protein [bacterium]